MKSGKQFAFCLVLMLATTFGLWGCASTKHHNDTQSLLSAAGFNTVTPTTPQQQWLYANMPPYQLQRHELNGKVVYAYADPKEGVLYVGGEPQYQRFQQLTFQQNITDEQLQTARMKENATPYWGYWGPSDWGPW